MAWLAVAVFVLVAGCLHPAAAEERIITAVTQSAADDAFTVEFDVIGQPDARILRLRNPDRIAVDFQDTLSAASLDTSPDNPLVAGSRHGLVAADRYRFIFTLKRSAVAELARAETSTGETLSLTIRAAASEAQAAAPSLAARPGGAPKVPVDPAAISADKTLKVVLDAGHGGVDRGAVSESGTLEKDINLAMALALRDALQARGDVDVVLTRDDDTFIPLEERAAIGRRERADLFISIHADSIRYANLRGATVYTLSETASDELSREIAASENAADRFAGAEWQRDEPTVFDILLDLTRRETVSFSEHFATSLVQDLQREDIRLIKRPKRSAGFKVLTAPDVPSVLVELGFLSNREDERLLTDPAWRKDAAAAIAQAVVDFFGEKVAEPRKPG
ncbi:N-acetylmuramoyl-L-alanine amidase [Aurantimonas sp. A2-1-M11]|uniref:N-acetylmuramoyl-L-alanine amidase n=1 Tax=Aurantimonas sp. A2-1-M11 TaxID=3113712 RepID=UPI002F9598E3